MENTGCTPFQARRFTGRLHAVPLSANVEGGRHLMPNRLFHEKSPYLLQHAHNPVDWYPWGEEAFNAARRLNKPIFLSIGYATCHWCHVMERESFEDPEIAAAINESFVSVRPQTLRSV